MDSSPTEVTPQPSLFDTPADLPVLPYAGTSGWSGSTASRRAAEEQDARGATANQQQRALTLLRAHAAQGATWREFADAYGIDHGPASRALSDLHKAGLIARLTETRGRSSIYVLPEYIHDRPTEPHGRRTRPAEPDAELGPEVVASLRALRGAVESGPQSLAYMPPSDLHRHLTRVLALAPNPDAA